MERAAKAILGAGSGAVVGLMAAGLLGAGVWGLGLCVVLLAAGGATLNLRAGGEARPAAPRAALGGVLSGAGLLLAMVVLFVQSLYVKVTGRNQLPLGIWPLTSKALAAAVVVALCGAGVSLLGMEEQRRKREQYGGGRMALAAMMAALATLALAGIGFLSGYGFPLG